MKAEKYALKGLDVSVGVEFVKDEWKDSRTEY